MNILFINACVRGEASNTLKLCQAALEEWKVKYPEARIREVTLEQARPLPLYPEEITLRDELRHRGELTHPMFDYAHEFAKADKILIGAPYWDLSFPAVLKIYFEHICVVDITFRYTEHGPVGCCQADELLYLTTAGGPVEEESHYGFTYIKGLCDTFFSVPKVKHFAITQLEMGGDISQMVAQGEEALRQKLRDGSL